MGMVCLLVNASESKNGMLFFLMLKEHFYGHS